MVNYPAQIDDTNSIPVVIDNTTPIDALVINRLRATIIQIQTELGVKPSGTYTTVKNRLNYLESILTGPGGGGTPTGAAGGDLSGTFPNPTVVNINGFATSSTTPNVGQAMIWDGYQWSPGSDFGSQDISTNGDIGLNNLEANSARIDGFITITATSAPGLSGSTQGKIYFDTSVNKFKVSENGGSWANLVSTGGATGSAGGDLSGTYPNPTVAKLQGRAVSTSAPTDTYVLTWSSDGNQWTPTALPTSMTMGGDVSGSSSAATVAKLQGRTVDTASPTDGYVLTWSNSSSHWTPASLPTSMTMGGDISGSSSAATVAKLQGRTVAATAPTDGYILTWVASGSDWEPKANSAVVTYTSASVNNVNTPFTVAAQNFILVDTSTSACTVTLPSSPTTLQQVVVTDIGDLAGTNNITIGGNGHNIQDPNNLGTPASSIIININGSSLTLLWNGTFWSLI